MTYPVPDNPEYDRLDDDPELTECPDCEGNGYLEQVELSCQCSRCQGRGEIPNPDLPESEQEAIRQAKGW